MPAPWVQADLGKKGGDVEPADALEGKVDRATA